MDSVDLNIDNYDLNDLLELFNLSYDFTRDELREAKKIVIKTHPDKSNLPKEYFLFFSQAYKTIYNIHQFRHNSEKNSDEYIAEKNSEHAKILDKIKNKPDFNKWFNDMFEKHKLSSEYEEGGYGEWFKNDRDIHNNEKISMNEMNSVFERKKEQLKQIVVKHDISDISSDYGSELSGDKPMYYSSGLFSNLQYDDLKRAHTETVVPVTKSDFENKVKYGSADELRSVRERQNIVPLSLTQSKQYLADRQKADDSDATRRAYKLTKQDEKVAKESQKWWSNLKQLTNS